ncbi:MAG: type IV pilus biogenesis/stability protein PilW [Halioglobus sp.]|nr:type IV pilus biogenesis/stability protein PilW [Halioglobus sp.]
MSNSNTVKSVVAAVHVLALGFVLAGCVTTVEGGFTEKASPEKALEQRVALARQYIGEGNWEFAKRNLELASEIDPRSAEVHEAFGLMYQRTGELELAQDHFARSISLDRNCSRCRNNYAAFLYSQEKYREAEQQLENVVKDTLYTQRPQAFVNLGLCRLQLEDNAGADEAFSRALSMDRVNRIALLELAHLRYDAGDLASATRHYNSYRSLVRQQSARGLWLGIRIARDAGERDAEASYALSLSNRFPESAEYQAYRRTVQGE